jgi:hypothetical protein
MAELLPDDDPELLPDDDPELLPDDPDLLPEEDPGLPFPETLLGDVAEKELLGPDVSTVVDVDPEPVIGALLEVVAAELPDAGTEPMVELLELSVAPDVKVAPLAVALGPDPELDATAPVLAVDALPPPPQARANVAIMGAPHGGIALHWIRLVDVR